MNIQRLSIADVATHNKATDLYVIIDENVYDLTDFQEDHPGEIQHSLNYEIYLSVIN